MSFYNNRYNVLFIHIPKTAGTSMERQVFLGGSGHATIRDFSNIPNGVFRFAFVRNPWDRFVSALTSHERYKDIDKEDFTYFVMYEPARNIFPADRVVRSHFLPQYHFVLDTDDKIGVDYIGRFEHLEADWAHVCETLDVIYELDHYRKGSHQFYKNYYTPETWDIIGNLYRRDMELFGYGNDELLADSAREGVLLR
jgi:hypothetical protein